MTVEYAVECHREADRIADVLAAHGYTPKRRPTEGQDEDELLSWARRKIARFWNLTERQAAVSDLLCSGRCPAEAAAELELSEQTVFTCIRFLTAKLGDRSLNECAREMLA